MEVIIDEDGCLRQPRVVKGLNKEADASAVDAVSRWVFKPATVRGVPTKVFYVLTINFP